MPASLSLTEGTAVARSAELERLLEALAITRLGSHVVAVPGSAPPPPPLSWAGDGWLDPKRLTLGYARASRAAICPSAEKLVTRPSFGDCPTRLADAF